MEEPFDTKLQLDADARRLALEVIATLVNIKRIAADQLLRPVGIPKDLIQRFLTERDATTGDPLTKRQGGALILDQLAQDADHKIVRQVIELASKWDAFHLAQDEYKARAWCKRPAKWRAFLPKLMRANGLRWSWRPKSGQRVIGGNSK